MLTTRTHLSINDVLDLDEDESIVMEIIEDLIKLGLTITNDDELVIRQAKREGISERKTKKVMKILTKLKQLDENENQSQPPA